MEKKLEDLEKEELIELIHQLIAQNANLMAENAELKARLNRNSSNSSTTSWGLGGSGTENAVKDFTTLDKLPLHQDLHDLNGYYAWLNMLITRHH
jgi:regulator of replication initiation timing